MGNNSKKNKREPTPSWASANNGHDHFTPMYDTLLNSPAYVTLSPVAKVIYLILRQEYKGKYTGNKVKCPYSTIESKGISRNSIYGGIIMLEAMGLITFERGGIGHQPSVYHFSDKWKLIKNRDEAIAIKSKVKAERAELKKRIKQSKQLYQQK